MGRDHPAHQNAWGNPGKQIVELAAGDSRIGAADKQAITIVVFQFVRARCCGLSIRSTRKYYRGYAISNDGGIAGRRRRGPAYFNKSTHAARRGAGRARRNSGQGKTRDAIGVGVIDAVLITLPPGIGRRNIERDPRYVAACSLGRKYAGTRICYAIIVGIWA